MTSIQGPTTMTKREESLSEALEAWRFNLMLEISGRHEDDMEVMIGGAFLDLRDLQKALDMIPQP